MNKYLAELLGTFALVFCGTVRLSLTSKPVVTIAFTIAKKVSAKASVALPH